MFKYFLQQQNRRAYSVSKQKVHSVQRMTIQLKMGLQPIQALPSLSKEGHWVDSLSNEEAYDEVKHEELKPLKQQYTSLRDLIVVSPTKRVPSGAQEVEWYDTTELKFKDRLLKLAARAYLQPIVRESTPEAHFIAQCWIAFTSRNKSLVVGLMGSLQRQAEACMKFFRAQTFNLVQLFKSQHMGSLQTRSGNPS